ncbi:VOC family protein [Marinobacterium sedimentorum]|uniref:VOC family protein n=1 Tax=Marinobacterium sedimentorum TaxID=2927804 RepID=UPI0020C6FC84|nr:VOC family protein [Marinobacterium sedimentorum]MCP8687681.1 VOC family protein [Marinobacterium sedimentorum]
MKIKGIEELRFGVEDIEQARQFLSDFGLAPGISDVQDAVLFHTQNQSRLYLYDKHDSRLPPAFEDGSTLRTLVWAVEQASDLDALAERLADVPGFARDADSVSCLDPNGMCLRFQLSTQVAVELIVPGINQHGDIRRVDAPSPVYDRARPIGIGHVVFFVEDLDGVEAFYREKLGFQVSDRYIGKGVFMRASVEGHHHDLFLLRVPNKPAGLNHVAFTVRDIHEVIGGGMAMNRKQWSTFIGPGRHPISSAYFWYVNSPLGGAFEYYTNDDYLTAAWQPRTLEHSLELFTEWAVEGGLDGNTRRQVVTGG